MWDFSGEKREISPIFRGIDGYGACSTPLVARPTDPFLPTLTPEDARVQLLEEITRKINLGARSRTPSTHL
jgi:hypothetical protein